MSLYAKNVNTCIQMFERDKNINIIKSFFTQLSTIAPVHLHCLLEACDTINYKMKTEEWLNNITLKEIRNHVVFIMYKDFQTILDEKDYYDKSIVCEKYISMYKPAVAPSIDIERLSTVLETLFYLNHVEAMKHGNVPLHNMMYSEWINKLCGKSLSHAVFCNVKLLSTV